MNKLPKIKIEFAPSGLGDIKKAFADIEKSYERLNSIQKTRLKKESSISDESVNNLKKEHKSKLTEEEKWAKNLAAIKERSAIMAGRFAAKQAAEEIREAQRAQREIQKEIEKTNKKRASIVKGVGSNVGGTVKSLGASAAGVVSGLVSIGGGFALADAARYGLSAESAAAKASVQSNGQISTKEVLRNSKGAAMQYGINQKDLIEGTSEFVAKTGDHKTAQELQDFFAQTSIAEGVNIKDLAGVAGMFKVQNPGLNAEEIKQLVLSSVQQGKLGAVELKDMAAGMAKATAGSSLYAGDQKVNQRKLAGLVQVGMAATGSADEAVTSVSNLSNDVLKNRAKFEARGIQVVKNGKITDINEILAKSIARTGGNASAIREMFGERSGKIAQVLTSTYDAAEKNKKGSGEKAILEYLKSVEDAQLSTKQLTENFNIVADTAEYKLEKAFNSLKIQLADKIIPQLEPLIAKLPELASIIVQLTDKFIGLVQWIESNKIEAAFLGIGAIVSKALVAEIASAAIGQAVSALLVGEVAVAGAALLPLGVAAGAVVIALAGLAVVLDQYSKTKAAEKEGEDAGETEAKADKAKIAAAEKQLEYGKKVEAEGGGDLVRIAAEEQLAKVKADIAKKIEDKKNEDKHLDENFDKEHPPFFNNTLDPKYHQDLKDLAKTHKKLEAYIKALTEDDEGSVVSTVVDNYIKKNYGGVPIKGDPTGMQKTLEEINDSMKQVAHELKNKPPIPTNGGTVVDNNNHN